jgi:hypothetical protein
MGLKRVGTVLLKKETRHSPCLCAATRKNNRIGSAPFRQASNNARGDQTAAPFNIPVFWDMTMDQPFGEAFCLHLQSKFEDNAAGYIYYKIFVDFLRLTFKGHLMHGTT